MEAGPPQERLLLVESVILAVIAALEVLVVNLVAQLVEPEIVIRPKPVVLVAEPGISVVVVARVATLDCTQVLVAQEDLLMLPPAPLLLLPAVVLEVRPVTRVMLIMLVVLALVVLVEHCLLMVWLVMMGE